MAVHFRRTAVAGAAVAAIAAAGAVFAQSASASTIPAGQIQICAQGDYSAFIHVLGNVRPDPNYRDPSGLQQAFTSVQPTHPADPGGGVVSSVVSPQQCQVLGLDTAGATAQVDVVGLRPDGSEFYITSSSWNSSQSGLGIGTEGTSAAPFVWQW